MDLQKELKDYFEFYEFGLNENNEILSLWDCDLEDYPHPLPDSVKKLFHCDLSNYQHPLPDSVEYIHQCDLEDYKHPISDNIEIIEE